MDWHTPATVEEYLDAQGTKQVTAINPTINITAEGMSEEVADDRYLAQSANLSDLADPAAAIEALNGDGDLAEFVNDHALGSVTSVSGVEPDVNGNVDLAAADVGAATSAQGSLADTAIQPGDDAGGALGGTFPNPTLNAETVQDLVAAFVAAGTGINVSYDDTLGTLTFSISDLAITNTFTVASEVAMLALTAQRGDVAVRSDLSSTFILAAEPASTLGNWVLLPTPTDSVLSVNGQTGAVTISVASIGAVPTTRTVNGHALSADVTVTKADVGLGNVDNTSDADKPISTATQAALDLKAPLSSPAFTDVPTAPTAPPGTDSTQIATTAFVLANAPSGGGTFRYRALQGRYLNPNIVARADAQAVTGWVAYVAVDVTTEQAWDAIAIRVATAETGATLELGLVADDPLLPGYPGGLIDSVTVGLDSVGTAVGVFASPHMLQPGTYWLASVLSAPANTVRIAVSSAAAAAGTIPYTYSKSVPLGATDTYGAAGFVYTGASIPASAPAGMSMERYLPLPGLRAAAW